MRWRVLIVRPSVDGLDAILGVLAHSSVMVSHEQVDSRPALLAALEREEWELVIYDPATRHDIPIELVYTHAPASAIVIAGDVDDMADELSRLIAARSALDA